MEGSKKQRKENWPQYTLIFSNVLTPMEEVQFVDDDRNPYQELESLAKVRPSAHVVHEVDAGLFDITEDLAHY